MGIENFKRWHWILIGLIVGLAIAYTNNGLEPTYPRTMGVAEFESMVTSDDLPGDRPRIKDIVLNPPIDASETAYHKPMQIITFKVARYDRARLGWVYTPSALRLELPFTPPHGDSETEGGSFQSYLQSLAQDYPFITYQVAWWKAPKAQYWLWALGCMLVIGGIWPTIQNLLVGAGFGAPKKKETYDLSRFGKYKEPAVQPAEKRTMSREEQDQLTRLTQNLQAELAPSGAKANVGLQAAANTDQPVRKLDNKPLEIAAIKTEEEEKEYKGEYYPVAKPGYKKEGNG